MRWLRYIDSDNHNLVSAPSADNVDRQLAGKTNNQTAFATSGIWIILKHDSAKQGGFYLAEGEIVGGPFKFRMLRVCIGIGTDLCSDLFNVHLFRRFPASFNVQ